MLTWLMVRLGLWLRWRLAKGDLRWTLILHDDDPVMLRETLSKVERYVAEGWLLTEQPSRKGVRQFPVVTDHPNF